jgi:hypothetical protein
MTVATPQLETSSLSDQGHNSDSIVELQYHDELIGCNPFYRSSVIRQRYTFDKQSNIEEYLKGEQFKLQYLKRFLTLKSFYSRNGIDKKFLRKLGSPSGVSFSLALMEAILAVEAATAFARHELNTVQFAGRKTFEGHFDIIWASQTPSLSSEIAETALVGLLELLPKDNSPIESDKNYSSLIEALLKRKEQGAEKWLLQPLLLS